MKPQRESTTSTLVTKVKAGYEEEAKLNWAPEAKSSGRMLQTMLGREIKHLEFKDLTDYNQAVVQLMVEAIGQKKIEHENMKAIIRVLAGTEQMAKWDHEEIEARSRAFIAGTDSILIQDAKRAEEKAKQRMEAYIGQSYTHVRSTAKGGGTAGTIRKAIINQMIELQQTPETMNKSDSGVAMIQALNECNTKTTRGNYPETLKDSRNRSTRDGEPHDTIGSLHHHMRGRWNTMELQSTTSHILRKKNKESSRHILSSRWPYH